MNPETGLDRVREACRRAGNDWTGAEAVAGIERYNAAIRAAAGSWAEAGATASLPSYPCPSCQTSDHECQWHENACCPACDQAPGGLHRVWDHYAREGWSHSYLSTACLHGEHKYCASMTGYQGAKRPAECKFCGAWCVCTCHTHQAAEPAS